MKILITNITTIFASTCCNLERENIPEKVLTDFKHFRVWHQTMRHAFTFTLILSVQLFLLTSEFSRDSICRYIYNFIYLSEFNNRTKKYA